MGGLDDTLEAFGAAGGANVPERGLFVIWEQARRDESAILADLARRFHLIHAYEIRWTPALVRRNYERFYSDLEVRGVYHEINKGHGSFVAATVVDPDPVHDLRRTSRGPRSVITSFHDAKLEYRNRAGHLGLHCSETATEFERDLMMLGLDLRQCDVEAPLRPWDGQIEHIEIDIPGANGWDSESELLTSLNAAVEYVVLGAPPEGAAALFGGAGEPALLTTAYHSVHTVLNAQPVLGYPPPAGGRFTVDVGGRRLPLSIRPVGDGFIDSHWARECLEHRVLDERRFYRPPDRDDLATRCYLALARRPHLTDADRRLIRSLADVECDGAGLAPTRSIDRVTATEVVDCHLAKRGYSRVVPRDPTVGYHLGGSGREQAVRVGRATVYVLTRAIRGFVRTRWLVVRDALVIRAPALRTFVRRWTRRS